VTAIYDYSSNTFNFTAKTEGDASISFTQVSGNFLSAIGVSDAADATAGIEKRGLNAEFILNGTTMTRTTNNFELSDLNFTLNGTGKSQVVVSQNTSAVVNMVEGFIEKYNSTLDYLDSVINETSVKDPQTEEQRKMGMLNSDPLLISIDSDLQSLLGTSVFEFDPVEGVSKSLGSLDEIGISSGGSIDQVVSGHLRLDSSKLVKALIEDPDRVAKMFAKDFVAIQGEAPTGAMDGSNKVFQLANDNVSLETSQRVQIVLNGTALTQVVDRSRTLNVDEFRMDYRSGSFELGATPVDTDSLLVNYAYTVDGGQEMGILARINKLLDNTTEVNTGSIETSVKSLRNSYTAMSERIKSEELRIESYREQMITIFTNLETSISDMNSQADYFASQMGASSSK
jgi:flagellar hook-associated protein 2